MGWLSRWRGAGKPSGSLVRAADDLDARALADFCRSRTGVEFFLEPSTTMTTHTVVAVAADGEWIRRRVKSPRDAGKLATRLSVPLYEVHKTRYPQRMRDWNAAHPERRIRSTD